MILLRDLGVSIRRNARRLLHGLGIASADGRALCSCRTGRWRILRTARLLWPRTSSCGIADRCRTGGICRMGSWLFSCHAGSRRSRRSRMICCWLRVCHVQTLHKGTALLNGFCLHISYLPVVQMIWHSCAAAGLHRASECSIWRNRIVRHCVWDSYHSGHSALCVRHLHKGAALLRRLGLYRLPLCAAAVIRLSCGTGRLNGSARWILACRFSCRTERNHASVILYRCAAARMGFRLGMYGLLLLRVLHDRAVHDGL